MNFFVLFFLFISFFHTALFGYTQSLEQLLEEKYREARLSEKIKENFDHNTLVDLKSIKSNQLNDLKALYSEKTKEQEELLQKYERASGEIYLLEKLLERKLRRDLDSQDKEQWIKELLYLSKLPRSTEHHLHPRYYLDLIVVLQSKQWSMGFPQLLKHYLSYSPVNKPLDPFQFSYQADYENKIDIESVKETENKTKLSLEKEGKPVELENLADQVSEKRDNKLLNLQENEDFPLEDLPTISFPEADSESEKETSFLENEKKDINMLPSGTNSMEIELIPNSEVSPLKAPKLKKVKKSKL